MEHLGFFISDFFFVSHFKETGNLEVFDWKNSKWDFIDQNKSRKSKEPLECGMVQWSACNLSIICTSKVVKLACWIQVWAIGKWTVSSNICSLDGKADFQNDPVIERHRLHKVVILFNSRKHTEKLLLCWAWKLHLLQNAAAHLTRAPLRKHAQTLFY